MSRGAQLGENEDEEDDDDEEEEVLSERSTDGEMAVGSCSLLVHCDTAQRRVLVSIASMSV